MSKICSTFAPEIGKGIVLTTSAGKAERATLGNDLQGIAGRKTHTADAREKERIAFTDFGLSVLSFSSPLNMKPTYIEFWRIIFDLLKSIWRRVSQL